MIRIRDLSLRPGEGEAQLLRAAADALRCRQTDILRLEIVRQSVDARKKGNVRVIYTVDAEVRGSEAELVRRAGNEKVSAGAQYSYRTYEPPEPASIPALRPVVVGFGPAGMFAALVLAEAGLRPIVLERGEDVDTRRRKVEAFWSGGALDPESNVQFGEGGAGTFSDGKLNTGTKGVVNDYVELRLIDFGAPLPTRYQAKPHIGTDVLRRIVKNLREHIISLGAEVCFRTKLTDLTILNGAVSSVTVTCDDEDRTIPCSQLILAPGHSARDTFELLLRKGIAMEPKPFSMGVRIEQKQSAIDRTQYGASAGNPALPAADYKLNCVLPDGTSAYTFCMCPGGYVVAAASEEGGIVTNGMSYSGRNGENANAALLVTLKPEDFPYEGVLGGVKWQREIERRAFEAGGGTYRAPAQLVGDYLRHKKSAGAGSVQPTYRPGVIYTELHGVLPKRITDTLDQALPVLDRQLHGFADPEAVLTAPETRSSSPVRILREKFSLQSSVAGLYPCGEGAGYAGGIVSAAADGVNCADALIRSLPEKQQQP